MKLAVLGASGFVGSRAIEHLTLTKRAEVRGIVRRYGGLARQSRFASDWRIADALDEDALAEAFAGCDYVLHSIQGENDAISRCAAPAYRAADRAGVKRIVFISSAAVWAGTGASEVSEVTPVPPVLEDYAAAKIRAERAFEALAQRGSVRISILRPSIIIGPRSPWISRAAMELLSGNASLGGGGKGYVNSLYVDNLIEAVLLACRETDEPSELFALVDEGGLSWRELYTKLAELLGLVDAPIRCDAQEPQVSGKWSSRIASLRSSRFFKAGALVAPMTVKNLIKRRLGSDCGRNLPGFPGIPHLPAKISALHRTEWKINSAKAEAELGFVPSVSVAQGVRRSAEWLRFAGFVDD